jgi:hypothetical protein
MTTESPFHPGEQALQHIVGVHEQAGRLGGWIGDGGETDRSSISPIHHSPRSPSPCTSTGRAYIRGYMPDQHRAFYEGARLFYLGTQDAAGRVWASVLAGQPGFVSSPTPTRLLLSPGAHASTGEGETGMQANSWPRRQGTTPPAATNCCRPCRPGQPEPGHQGGRPGPGPHHAQAQPR